MANAPINKTYKLIIGLSGYVKPLNPDYGLQNKKKVTPIIFARACEIA